MALRIAFDLDGVLADMEGELARHAERLFGERIARRAPDPSTAAPNGNPAPSPAAEDDAPVDDTPALKLELSARQQGRLWHQVLSIDNFWETLPQLEEGTIARIASLAVERRWEVIFLTKRPESAGATSQLQTQRWLERYGFTLPSVYVVPGSRGRIAAALSLDIVIDDRPENCLDVSVESRARAILVWRDDEKLLPAAARRLGIGVVKTMAECLDILTEIDADTLERPGVVQRVMRALGLKGEPART